MTTELSDPWEQDLAGPSTRAPRTLETREKSARPRVWVEPQRLPDPIPQDGWVFKWVRVSSRNIADNANFQRRNREGWEAVRAEDHPETMAEVGVTQKTGLVEIGGLVLCKMPEEMVAQRTEHYQRMTREKDDSAEEHYMRDNSELVKKFAEKRAKKVFGR